MVNDCTDLPQGLPAAHNKPNESTAGQNGLNVIQVEVIVAASPSDIWRQTLTLPEGATVETALRHSDFPQRFPLLAQGEPDVGVHGQLCTRTRKLNEGDRIEIYRPLRFDPIESRRRRAEHKLKQKNSSRAR